tara:strand:- start:27120 stop:28193 length:1074 start_codon:yes stop_codon:yes gene_type:complete
MRIKLFFIIIALLSFLLGIFVSINNLFPFNHLNYLNNFSNKIFKTKGDNFSSIKEIGKYAFGSELINKKYLINKSINSVEEINQSIQNFSYPIEMLWNFENRNKNYEISQTNLENTYKLKAETNNEIIESFAHKISNGNRKAILFIPDGTSNLSFKILKKIKNKIGNLNYLKEEFDIFLYIRPNNGVRAIHNGNKKLNLNHLGGWMINSGYSFTSSYLLETFFWTEYLKSNYETVAVIGFSQGGMAGLYNCLFTNPDRCVVASGYSVLNHKYSWNEIGGFIIPNINEKIDKNFIEENISKNKTKYMFSWGIGEKGQYLIEANLKLTCKNFKDLNIDCIIHDGGHELPKSEIVKFLNE